MLQIRDLPLERCLAVRTNTSVSRVAELATEVGARYVLVRHLTGDVKGVQLTSVAQHLAKHSPTVTAEELPVVESVQVEPEAGVLEVLSELVHSQAPVLLVQESSQGPCSVVMRSLVEMTFGVATAGAGRPTLRS